MILLRQKTYSSIIKRLDIYTDGSDLNKQNKSNNRLGIGGVAVDLSSSNIIDEFSEYITKDYMKKNYNTDDCSNPTMEMLAVLYALRNFKGIFSSYDQVVFHEDYLGCMNWCLGKWKINKPYIQKIKNEIDNEIKQQKLDKKIEFAWVKGHQKDNTIPDVKWNNYVDLLAKGEKSGKSKL